MPQSGYNRNLWEQRLHNANKVYGDWETKFRCRLLEQYYEGWQWKGKKDFFTVNYMPYTINLTYNTIKIKMASLLFQNPSFLVTPRPGNSDWDLDFAVRSAQLKQDVLNTIVKNPNTFFTDNFKLVLLDSYFRFGIMEVGYAADWRNPQKQEPLLKSWLDEDVAPGRDKVVEDVEVPVNERFYVKRIPPRRFRCSLSESTELRDHEWVGYYEFFYTSVLQKTKGIKWPDDAPDSSFLGADYAGGILADPHNQFNNPEYASLLANGQISKVWHIWDLIEGKRKLLLDGHEEVPLWEDDCDRLPLYDLRWDLRTEGFYPLPPVFQWISPQDEINEAREQTRSYRRRFTRKFQVVKDSVDEEEIEKFVSGPDGIVVTVKQIDALKAIDNPEQGPTTEGALILAKDDFNIISGTSAEARGQMSDRETATQAKLVDTRSQMRESSEQLDYSNYVCRIGREVLCQVQEKLTDGLWVSYTENPSNKILQDVQINAPNFKYIRSQDISDGYDFTVDLDITNATPAAMEQTKQAFMNFTAMMQNYPMLAKSPVLVRETAYRCGYRNEQVIQQMQQAALVQQMAEQMQGQQTSQGGNGAQNPNNAAQAQVAQQMPNGPAQNERQIQQQLRVQ